MTITKVKALSGSAEIQGVERDFHWDGEDLILRGLSYSETTRVLDALSTGKMWDERPPVQEAVTVERATNTYESPMAKAAEALREKGRQEAARQEAATAPKPAPEKEAGPTLAVVKDVPTTAAPVNGAAFELQKADSLLKVLTFLKGQGFADWQALLNEVTRLREEVPVLKKINEAEFKDRVLRVMNTKLQMDVPENA